MVKKGLISTHAYSYIPTHIDSSLIYIAPYSPDAQYPHSLNHFLINLHASDSS